MFPLLVSCLALTVIALGVGERKVRKDRRKAGWKGIGGLVAGSGEFSELRGWRGESVVEKNFGN